MDLFLSHSGFVNPAWRGVSGNTVITEEHKSLEHLTDGDTLWILTLHEQWANVVEQAVHQGCQVVVLATIPNSAEMNEALTRGALCYCPAVADQKTIQAVKVAVSQESIWVPAKFLRQLTGSMARLLGERDYTGKYSELGLTARETSVTELIIEGLSNSEIAEKLYVSERTVKEHLTNIFKKLKIKDRLQLALLILKSN